MTGTTFPDPNPFPSPEPAIPPVKEPPDDPRLPRSPVTEPDDPAEPNQIIRSNKCGEEDEGLGEHIVRCVAGGVIHT